MNISQIPQQGPGMQPVLTQPGTPQAQQQMQSQVPQQHAQEKLDNISKVKSLIGQLRESLGVSLIGYMHFVLYGGMYYMLIQSEKFKNRIK